VNCPHGKLRLRVVKYTDADALLEFFRLNCDILEISWRKSVDEPDKLRLWHETGVNCQQLMKKMDESLQIRYLWMKKLFNFFYSIVYIQIYKTFVQSMTFNVWFIQSELVRSW